MFQLVEYSDSSSEDEDRPSSHSCEPLYSGETEQVIEGHKKQLKLKVDVGWKDRAVRESSHHFRERRDVISSGDRQVCEFSHNSEQDTHPIELPITDESDEQSYIGSTNNHTQGDTVNVCLNKTGKVSAWLKIQDEKHSRESERNGSNLSSHSHNYLSGLNLCSQIVCSVTENVDANLTNTHHTLCGTVPCEKNIHHDLLPETTTEMRIQPSHISSWAKNPLVIVNESNICNSPGISADTNMLSKGSHNCHVETSYKSEKTVQSEQRDSQSMSQLNRKRKLNCDSHKLLPLPDAIHSMYDGKQQRWMDDPTLHDNRVRSFPHLEGNWATHVFVPVTKRDLFVKFVDHLLELLMPQTFQAHQDFHISLSRTVAIRYHWIEPLVDSLRENVMGLQSSISNITDVKLYTNDEKTRTFVSLELSQDEEELMDYVRAVNKSFAEFNLPSYYENPSFHISVGWCLGDVVEKITDEKLLQAQELLGEFVAASPVLSFVYSREICCQSGCKLFMLTLENSDK